MKTELSILMMPSKMMNEVNIFSQSGDHSGDLLTKYFFYLTYSLQIENLILRFNREEKINALTHLLSNDDTIFKVDIGNFNKVFGNSTFSYLTRRCHFQFDAKYFKNQIDEVNKFHSKEAMAYINYLFNFLELNSNIQFGQYHKELEDNKLIQLYYAQKNHLKIPKTIITTSKNELETFMSPLKEYIIKPITNQTAFEDSGGYWQSTGTSLFTNADLNNLNESFFPTLVQERIDKKYEIRTFFYEDNYWSMAMLTQKNDKTRLDYRNYDTETPNRRVPISIGETNLSKIRSTMNSLNLHTGSIDFIVDKNDELVFLEVNPTGQFGMVSSSCNYNIEKFIANKLINER